MKKDKKHEPLVGLIGCLGCGLQVAGCGGVCEASPTPPPCMYRGQGVADAFGAVKTHLPYRVKPGLSIEVFDYTGEGKTKKQVKVEGQRCNARISQKGELRPYACNTLFNSADGRLKLNDLIEIGNVAEEKERRRGKKKRPMETAEAESPTEA